MSRTDTAVEPLTYMAEPVKFRMVFPSIVTSELEYTSNPYIVPLLNTFPTNSTPDDPVRRNAETQ